MYNISIAFCIGDERAHRVRAIGRIFISFLSPHPTEAFRARLTSCTIGSEEHRTMHTHCEASFFPDAKCTFVSFSLQLCTQT
jgi:hypothetical protein